MEFITNFLEWIRIILVIIILGFLLLLIIESGQLLLGKSRSSIDEHRCAQCKKIFPCFSKNNNKNKNQKNSNNGVNGFKRKTIYVGSFPMEVSDTTPIKRCCVSFISKSSEYERFCTFACYRLYVK